MYRVDVRIENRRNFLVSIAREAVDEAGAYRRTVPIEEGYQAAALDLLAQLTGRAVSSDEVEWNIAPEPHYSDAVVTIFNTLEGRLASGYTASTVFDERAVGTSMDQVDNLLRVLPDQVEGHADVRALLLESMESMMEDFDAHQFDEEVLWSHGRVLDNLPRDLSTMPDNWRYQDVLAFAFMAYPHDGIGVDELVDECSDWDEIKRIAEFHDYIYRYFHARINGLDDSVKHYLLDSSVGPTNYSSAQSEYGFDVRIPYVVICHLHEQGDLRQFLTRQTEFDELWAALGSTGKQLPLEVHRFLSTWSTSWTGAPIDQRAVPDSYFDEYSNLPDIVHSFWREVGFAGFDQGLLWVCDPHDWQPIVDEWLAGLDLPDTHRTGHIPLIRTAFGEIICFTAGLGNLVRIDPLAPEILYVTDGYDFGTLISGLSRDVRGAAYWRRAFEKIVAELGALDHARMYLFDPLPFAGEDPRGAGVVYQTDRAVRADARSAMSTIRAAASVHLLLTPGRIFRAFSGRGD
ncbi:GAD-like domain-containing protein [Williamsia soli]|uniref:GAD-like domain-containing protein n=1 Tax=Williamsia soli TaxID=364929 RepID=UPI001A9EBA92|nr:GAD-like domain-containing protein [Williamsia soli]